MLNDALKNEFDALNMILKPQGFKQVKLKKREERIYHVGNDFDGTSELMVRRAVPDDYTIFFKREIPSLQNPEIKIGFSFGFLINETPQGKTVKFTLKTVLSRKQGNKKILRSFVVSSFDTVLMNEDEALIFIKKMHAFILQHGAEEKQCFLKCARHHVVKSERLIIIVLILILF